MLMIANLVASELVRSSVQFDNVLEAVTDRC